MNLNEIKLRKKIKALIAFFIVGLVISGVTAFPLEWELFVLVDVCKTLFAANNPLLEWTLKVYTGLQATYNNYPFIAYGTDWLAFAHLVIAVVFIGPLRDPVKNVWVIQFGIIACLMVFPLALIAGQLRGIPFFWRLIDCAFGAMGIIPLVICNSYIKRLTQLTHIKL